LTDLTDILLQEGKTVQYEAELELDELRYRFGRFRVTDKSPAVFTVEHTEDGQLLLDGHVHLQVSIPCARCLEPVSTDLDVQFELQTDMEKKEYIDGHNLDVDQLVHDEALLVWPERVLCREDCSGLCPTCGQNLNHGSCECERTDLDPRMAKVLDIFSNFKEV
jgi:uncharacterized protein